MSFFKEVFKKLLIAAVTGGLILGFVFVKDSYLEEGSTDTEMLQATSIQKESKVEKVQSKETKKEEVVKKEVPKMVIEVEEPEEVEVVKTIEKQPVKAQPQETVASNDTKIEEQSFEDFKGSMGFSGHKDAFDELDKETN